MWPEPLTPGMDWVRDIGGARLVVERDLEWAPESGEAFRGRYGMKVEVAHEDEVGEAGEIGLGSVLRLRVGGLRRTSMSSVEAEFGLWMRREGTEGAEGTGEGRNSSIRSVSGTGSMVAVVVSLVGWIVGPPADG